MARTVPPASGRPTRRVVLLAAIAVVLGLGATGCRKEDSPVQGEGAPGIDAVAINQEMLQFLADKGAAGATVAVTRRGRLVWSTSYGWADQAEQIRMQPWHRSKIGSVSKVITAIGLLQLLEASAIGGLTTGPSTVDAKLSLALYGDPGSDFASPDWPEVTGPTALDDPELYWEAIRDGVQGMYPQTFETEMARFIDWGSAIQVRHLLTHTSGHLLSNDWFGAADEYAGGDYYALTYSQLHRYMLSAEVSGGEGGDNVQCADEEVLVEEDDPADSEQTFQLPPLLFEAGTQRCYSNHGFVVLGMLVDELAGPATYQEAIRQNILEPLGVTDVVPLNTDISELDAWPHGDELDPDKPSHLGTSTGGWAATATDLVRILCGLDRDTTHLRLLQPQTMSTMETVAFPEVDGDQPLGFDRRGTHSLVKSGAIGGGRSRIVKFLPGKFDAAPDDEINIAVNVNSAGQPSDTLLATIAGIVAAADIPEDYDLFDPAYPCVVPDEELGLAVPTPTPTATPGPTLVAPAPTSTQGPTLADPTPTGSRPTPPTVVIRQPTAGAHLAPRGVAQLAFSGLARAADGTVIPGTYYRWTATQAGTKTLLCAGSGIGTGAPPTTIGGLTTIVDCTSFAKALTNPFPGTGPPITIQLEARDAAGTLGSTTVVIVLTPPPGG
jgi:CubicO group peptidase (beta-lactamase class C family)